MFKDALRHHLGSGATDTIVDAVFESITSTDIPAEGTPQRKAVDLAYSDVMRNITYVAVGTSALCFVIAFFLPDLILKDGQSLVPGGHADTHDGHDETVDANTGEAEGGRTEVEAGKI